MLAGCWGWIPPDPASPGPVAAGAGAPAPAASPAQGGAASRPAPAPASYSVVSGDTLFSIAWRFRLQVKELAAWNNLGDGSLIFVGQRLRLTPPAGRQGSASSASSPSAAARASPAPATSAQSGAAGARPRTPASGRSRTVSGSRAAAGGGKWRWPAEGSVDAKGARVRSGDYGVRIMGQRGQNIHAADSGKVMYAGAGLKAYGLLVIVQHSPEWLSAYGHNERILVSEGDEVKAGQAIATMGIGPANTAMLHFEIRRNGKPVEPIRLLPRRN